jgi:transcriptional regulator with XRE-family HTH domain
MRLRQKLIDERERLDMTQEEVAAKAGVRQGLVSRWEDLSVEMTDPSARVLFLIIERAFGKTLTAFFGEIEDVPVGANLAEGSGRDLSKERAHGDPLPSSTISASDLERFARTIGRSIGREMRPQAARRRAPKTRARGAKRR